jgi:hypothetical protein
MKLKLRSRVKFFAALLAGNGTSVRKDGLAAYVDLNYSALNEALTFNPTDSIIAIYHPSSGIWEKISLSTFQVGGQSTVVKTTSGDVNVASADGVIVLNKASGAATAVNLPLAVSKVGPVLVTDLKGDAGTNTITVVPTAPETIQGQATWTISANNGSIFLRPVPGIGYVI